ncbi:MAG: metal-dependent transcriptional regulator [Mailhella sp.]|nr:metal-dependent transcriptional regulator [Mailhella sp.]
MPDKTAPYSDRPLTPSLENYLKIILREEQASGTVHASAIADAAGVSRATVTSTLKALRGMGLIDYTAYGPILLTEEGRRIGRDLMHRHIVFREFFQHVLQFDEAQADAVAGELGRILPRHVVRRCGRFVLYLQKNKSLWENWQDDYEKDRQKLLAELGAELGNAAGLSSEETEELAKKYR